MSGSCDNCGGTINYATDECVIMSHCEKSGMLHDPQQIVRWCYNCSMCALPKDLWNILNNKPEGERTNIKCLICENLTFDHNPYILFHFTFSSVQCRICKECILYNADQKTIDKLMPDVIQWTTDKKKRLRSMQYELVSKL